MRVGKRDFIWSYIGTILNVSVSALILPFVLIYLSADELGLWYVFATVGTLVSLLDFGFTPTVSRNIAYSWSGANALSATETNGEVGREVNVSLFCLVLKTCKSIYAVISACALVIMVIPGTVYIWTIAHINDPSFWLESWLIYAGAIYLNLLFTYANSYLRGIGAVAESSKAAAIAKLFHLFLTILLLALGLGLLGTAIGYFISVFVFRVLSKKYFDENAEAQKILRSCTTPATTLEKRNMFKTMWHNAWRDGLVSFAGFLSTQINTLTCSFALGLSSTGFYGLAMQVSAVIMTVAAIWYTTIQPKLQEYAAKRNTDRFAKLFTQAIAIFCLIAIPLTLISALVGPPLIDILRKDMDFNAPLYLAICLYMLIYRGNALFTSGISNFNVIPYTKAYVITGIISAAVSFALALFTDLGIWSLVLPPFIAFAAYNSWRWPQYMMELLGCTNKEFLRMGMTGLQRTLTKLRHLK